MTNATSLHLSPNQFAHARDIVAEVKHRGQPKRVAVIAMETALAESGLQMYANGNNPASLNLPHDAVGWDHGSVGLFQQQVGGAAGSTANWGTTKELMNVRISCGKFLDALHAINLQNSSNWAACQDVQHSAYDGHPRPANNNSSVYGGNYQAQDNRAAGIVNALWTGPVGQVVQQPAGRYWVDTFERAPVLPEPGGTNPTGPVDQVVQQPGGKYWVDTFERAPVLPEPGGTNPTGALYRGRNYVFGKRWGKKVETAQGFNHWWLKTDPDEGTGHWVSAYYLTHWGNDEAKDNDGHDLPNC